MINWTLSWKKSAGDATHKSAVNAASISAALADFHVERQRIEKLERDDYVIIQVESDHRFNKTMMPQSYIASDFPLRNPDANGIALTTAAEAALMKRISDRETSRKKGGTYVG